MGVDKTEQEKNKEAKLDQVGELQLVGKSLKGNSFSPQKVLNLTFKYCHFTENLSHREKGREILKAMKNSPLL